MCFAAQMKKYDEVIEDYRCSIYALRRLVLQGSAQQRTQVGPLRPFQACSLCSKAAHRWECLSVGEGWSVEE